MPQHMQVSPDGQAFYDANFGQWLPVAGYNAGAPMGQESQALTGAPAVQRAVSLAAVGKAPAKPTGIPVVMPDGSTQYFATPAEASKALSAAQAQAPATAAKSQADTAAPGNTLRVKMPDGSIQTFSGEYWKDVKLDAALKGKGIPLDPTDGSEMKVTPGVYGGYLFNGLPINTIATGEFLPQQKETLANYYAAGYTPGGPPLENPPALPPEAKQYYPGENSGGGSPFDFGYLTQPFTEEFQAPGGKPAAFTENFQGPRFTEEFKAPTGEEFANDPGTMFMLSEAQKALDRKASSSQYLSTPRADKEMTRYTTDYLNSKYGDFYGRKLGEFESRRATNQDQYGRDLTEFGTRQANAQQNLNNWQTEWQQKMGEFAQKRDIFRTNRSDIYNFIAPLAGMGQSSANATGNYGINFGNQAGNNITDAANAQAAAEIAKARAKYGAVGNILNNGIGLTQVGRG